MRKLTRSSFTLVLLFVLLSTLTGTAAAAPPTPRAKWTIMVYISGDNNLEDYVVSDIETELAPELPPAGSTAIQVVALADRGPGYDTSRGDWQQTLLFHVTKGMTADLASAVPDPNWQVERDMGDPQTLVDFVTWTRANYPADHYALYFWGHGWSWHPGYVMQDDTTEVTQPENATLDYHETRAAIPSLGFIDVIGYDGCNMASIEILDLWHGHATAVSSSQEWVGWEGIEYDQVIKALVANPGMNADQVAIATSQSASSDKTWSAVAVDRRLDALLQAIDDWSLVLTSGLATNRKQYDQAFTATRNFWQAPMDKDLYDMALEIKSRVADKNIQNKSQAVMDAFANVILDEHHTNAYSEVHGITIYHISKATEKDDDYRYYHSTVDFAQQTAWDEFLDAYAQ